MATCATISSGYVEAAKDKIAAYIIYYTTGNTTGSCTCKTRCNDSTQRTRLKPLINDTVSHNAGLYAQFKTIACNMQLGGSSSQIEGQCRDMARAILQVNNTPATAKCPAGSGGGGGGSGGGLGGFDDIQAWLSGNTGGIPNFAIVAGIGVLTLFLFMRR